LRRAAFFALADDSHNDASNAAATGPAAMPDRGNRLIENPDRSEPCSGVAKEG
jgi:hypothetical protein